MGSTSWLLESSEINILMPCVGYLKIIMRHTRWMIPWIDTILPYERLDIPVQGLNLAPWSWLHSIQIHDKIYSWKYISKTKYKMKYSVEWRTSTDYALCERITTFWWWSVGVSLFFYSVSTCNDSSDVE